MAIPNASICFDRPDSIWVHSFILMCDNSMAVWFNHESHRIPGTKIRLPGPPGVCCWYPQATKGMWEAAIVWGSAGKFVHQFLYKKLPYTLIKPPCPAVGCGQQTNLCPEPIPNILHFTVVPSTCTQASCSGELDWSASFGYWQYKGALGTLSSSPWTINFKAPLAGTGPSDFVVQLLPSSAAPCQGDLGALSCTGTCSPLAITTQVFKIAVTCGCSANDSDVKIVVTQ
jgi:hypothetical protein